MPAGEQTFTDTPIYDDLTKEQQETVGLITKTQDLIIERGRTDAKGRQISLSQVLAKYKMTDDDDIHDALVEHVINQICSMNGRDPSSLTEKMVAMLFDSYVNGLIVGHFMGEQEEGGASPKE